MWIYEDKDNVRIGTYFGGEHVCEFVDAFRRETLNLFRKDGGDFWSVNVGYFDLNTSIWLVVKL